MDYVTCSVEEYKDKYLYAHNRYTYHLSNQYRDLIDNEISGDKLYTYRNNNLDSTSILNITIVLQGKLCCSQTSGYVETKNYFNFVNNKYIGRKPTNDDEIMITDLVALIWMWESEYKITNIENLLEQKTEFGKTIVGIIDTNYNINKYKNYFLNKLPEGDSSKLYQQVNELQKTSLLTAIIVNDGYLKNNKIKQSDTVFYKYNDYTNHLYVAH